MLWVLISLRFMLWGELIKIFLTRCMNFLKFGFVFDIIKAFFFRNCNDVNIGLSAGMIENFDREIELIVTRVVVFN